MDTLASSVSSLKVPPRRIHKTSLDFSRFGPTASSSSHHHLLHHPQNQQYTSNNPSNKNHLVAKSSPTFPSKCHSTLILDHQASSSRKQSQLLHQNAASGYAAALINVAQSSNSLQAVQRDVKRLLKLLCHHEQLGAFMGDPRVEDIEKGKVVKEIADKCKFHKHLAVLLKVLIHKPNVAVLLSQVLAEFERIYHVLLSSSDGMKKVGDESLNVSSINKEDKGAERITGAFRHSFDDKLFSFVV